MAASIATSGHSRSISLPSRSHPSTANVDEHLCRQRSSEDTSCSSPYNKLVGVKGLYESLDGMLQLPIMQRKLSTCDKNVLGASLRLLDLCSTTKDAFSQMRTFVQDLESSLRRREADVSSKVKTYFMSMKKVHKMVSKSFTSLKKMRNNTDNDNLAMLREVEEVSVKVFESLFQSICPEKETSKQSRWSMVAKLTKSKRVDCEERDVNEVQKLHIALEALYKQKPNMDSDILKIQEVQKYLVALDMNMQQCEEDLDCLLRSSIKTRVSLLNVLNH